MHNGLVFLLAAIAAAGMSGILEDTQTKWAKSFLALCGLLLAGAAYYTSQDPEYLKWIVGAQMAHNIIRFLFSIGILTIIGCMIWIAKDDLRLSRR